MYQSYPWGTELHRINVGTGWDNLSNLATTWDRDSTTYREGRDHYRAVRGMPRATDLTYTDLRHSNNFAIAT